MSNLKQFFGYGSPFAHDVSSCHNSIPSKFEWIFNKPSDDGIEIYLDYNIAGGFESQNKNKFLWLSESKGITQQQIDFLKKHIKEFQVVYKKIFVHDKELINFEPSLFYCPPASNSSWVVEKKIYPKTKLISMISSGRNICSGHTFRNNMMQHFQNLGYSIDYYGRLFNPFQRKEDVLKDYCFSITIESEKYSNYYTEKIMDCFACGTIPIYHGSPEIGNMFNMDGIIVLDDKFDINNLSLDLYYSKLDAIKDNFERCINHQTADDYLYEEVVKSI